MMEPTTVTAGRSEETLEEALARPPAAAREVAREASGAWGIVLRDRAAAPLSPRLRDAETARELAGLRRAEQVLVAVRILAVGAWPFLLAGQSLPVPVSSFAVFYTVAIAYTATTAVLAHSTRAGIRAVAIGTTIADSVTVTIACFLTGGLTSVVLPTFYFTVLATSIRFGMRESFALVAWTSLELTLLYTLAPGSSATPRDLAVDVFYLSGVALMSGLLAGEARRHDRRALREGDKAGFLLAVDRAIHSTLDLEILLPRILDEALDAIPCRGAGIMLLDPVSGAPGRMVVAGDLPAPETEPVRESLVRGVLAEARREGIVVLNDATTVRERLLSDVLRRFVSESFVAIALRRREDAGFLVLADKRGGGGFTAGDLELLRAVADLAAVAIEDARLVDDLRDANERSRELLRRLLAAEEEERRRIAGEIHDRLGAVFFDAQAALRRSRERAAEAAPALAADLAELEHKVADASNVVRNLMNELRPSVLDDFGFTDALRDYVAGLPPGGPEIVMTLDGRGRGNDVILFRIAQEAILNARKHAGAQTLTIDHRGGGTAPIELVVRDDGRGFDPSAPHPGHYGLRTMRERVEAAGGDLVIRSRPGEGTEIRVHLPEESSP